jgi:DNA polymerase-3 subunit chi
MPADVTGYARVVLIFEGDDPEAVDAARAHWTAAKAQGLEATYWQPDENGRWQRKG